MKLFKKHSLAVAMSSLLMVSSPFAYAADNIFTDADLESISGFANGNSGFVNGPKLNDGTTNAYAQTGGGWCRFINNDRTQSGGAGVTEHAPDGNDTVVAFCNHGRALDAQGISRVVENIEIIWRHCQVR